MRNPVIAMCLAAVLLIYADRSANAADLVYKALPPPPIAEPQAPGPSRYYSDYGWFSGSWLYGPEGGYGPFHDCNGTRCYIGPPSRRHYGQYYYGPTGGYYRGGWYN